MTFWVGFDADDTLWHSEHHFMASHDVFCDVVRPYLLEAGRADPDVEARRRLAEIERANITAFGYGLKGAALSMIEAAVELSDGRVSAEGVVRLLDRAKEMAVHPVELFDGAVETLDALNGHHLALVTKGDLLDQRRKIDESELASRFDAVEIVHEKSVETYAAVLARHAIEADAFVMVGNSMRSDIWPVLELGGWAVHVPFADTWAFEHAEAPVGHERFVEVATLRDVPEVIASIVATRDSAP